MNHTIRRTAVSDDVVVIEDAAVPMRDGVRLFADIYLPAGAARAGTALPVLLERTPYDKRGQSQSEFTAAAPQPRRRPEVARVFAAAGYAVVVQDCRGRYRSEGAFTKYVNEAEDGFDTLAWIAAQPWCDGQVGTYGLSYGAHVQMAAACLNPPALRCMVVDCGGFSDAYRAGIRQGGAFELKQLTWAYRHALLSPLTQADPARKAALEAEDIRDWFTRLPWSEGNSPLRAAPEYEDYVLRQWRSGDHGPYWTQLGLAACQHFGTLSDVPMVHISGWYDPYASTAVENYLGLVASKRGPVHLILGPWTHGQRSVSHAGAVDFGPAARFDGSVAPDYDRFRLAWFDRWLKGAPAAADPPVRVFVMGGGSGRRTAEGRLDHGGSWRTGESWPLPGTRFVPHFLVPGRGLSADGPDAGPHAESFVADPDDPVPTIGGAIASGRPVMEPGAFDQVEGPDFFGSTVAGRRLSDRPDVLSFQTPPLARDVEVVGPISAVLYVASDAPDTDITIKLVDVHPPSPDWPDGFDMNVANGILRLRYRNSWDVPEPLELGTVHRVVVEAFPTANRFLKGHRIRLDIASSNFPHFDVNPNTGGAQGMPGPRRKATNTIRFDCDHPSHVILPIIGDAP